MQSINIFSVKNQKNNYPVYFLYINSKRLEIYRTFWYIFLIIFLTLMEEVNRNPSLWEGFNYWVI